jgi:hypothetical protein
MRKKLTTADFISKATLVHGNKYDYSKIEYVNSSTKVCIICPKHGEFWQNAKSHLQGHGCKKCFQCSKHKYDVAINDIPNSNNTHYYNSWRSLLERTVGKTYKERFPTYSECTICDEWLTLSNFKEWFENPENGYKEGYHLDKDLLFKGNKHYSPLTCCFLPPLINTALVTQIRKRGVLPIGVQRKGNFYYANLMFYNKKTHIGGFISPVDAFHAYKNAKEQYIKELAEKYFREDKITEKVYHALMKYKVEITD